MIIKLILDIPKKVSIGNNVTINRGVRLFSSYHLKDVIIEIEDNCAIDPEVCMFDMIIESYHYQIQLLVYILENMFGLEEEV